MEPERALFELGGAARRNAILARGVALDDLMSAWQLGTVLRPHRGTYVLPGTARSLVVAASLRGLVGCVSACDWWGLSSITPPSVPHVIVPASRHIMDDRLRKLRLPVVHRYGEQLPGRIVEPIEDAIDHASCCTSPLEHLVIIDSALRKARIDPLGGLPLSSCSPERAAWLERHASRLAQSVPESVAGALLAAAGLHPERQREHEGVGHVDAGVGPHHSVEVDGFETHGQKSAFAEDRRRDREMAAARKWTLRYTYDGVMKDMRAFVHDVARIMGRRVDSRFDARLAWMTTRPSGQRLNRPGHG